MKPAAEKLKAYLDNVNIAISTVPVVHNADVLAYGDKDRIKDALVRQLYSPVRWVETIQTIYSKGITTALECGPGKVLAGLNKRIVAEMSCIALISQDALTAAILDLEK